MPDVTFRTPRALSEDSEPLPVKCILEAWRQIIFARWAPNMITADVNNQLVT